MKQTVQKGKTLLVDGPASVALESGKVDVLGSQIGTTSKIVIREGKRLPFAVEETATLDIALGENAAVEEIEGNTVPPSWIDSCEKALNMQSRPATIIVLGTVDSGKSSFCTYLVNKALREKRRVAVLDGDLGQSDIGPPSTVAYAFVTKTTTDLFNLQARNAFFVGDTSPSRSQDKVIQGLALLQKEILANNPEFIVINTDGWTEGENAGHYKVKLIEELNPDLVVCIQKTDELTHIISALEKFDKVAVESPQAIRRRDMEKRRSLRELGYIKYFGNAKVQSLSLSWLKFEGNELFGLSRTHMKPTQASKIYDLLGMKPLHLSELADRICVVIGRRRWIDSENIRKAEEFAKKKIVVARKGDEEGSLAAMYDAERRFLGIGVVQEIDYHRRILKILTPVSGEVALLSVGRIKLDKNMKEIPAIEEEILDYSSFSRLF